MSKIGKRAMLLLLALPIGFNVMAQETKKPTLEELIPGGESYRYADNLYGLQWWGDECIKPGVDTFILSNKRERKQWLSLVNRSTKCLKRTRQESYHTCIPSVSHADKPQMLFKIAGSSLYMISRTIKLSALSNPKTEQIMKTIAQPVETWHTR